MTILVVSVFIAWASFPFSSETASQTPEARDNANAHIKTAVDETQPYPIVGCSLGATLNVHHCGNLFLAGQFGPEEIQLFKEKQFDRIITLRTDGEIAWDEESAVQTAGLSFVKIPFRSPDSLTDKVFDRVRELLNDKSQKTLFHCGSANRVGGVWLPYRVLDEGVPLKKAMAEAKQIGLDAPFIEQKAIDYIRRKLVATPAPKSDSNERVETRPLAPESSQSGSK